MLPNVIHANLLKNRFAQKSWNYQFITIYASVWLIGVVIRYSTLLGSTWYTEEQGLFWCTFEISCMFGIVNKINNLFFCFWNAQNRHPLSSSSLLERVAFLGKYIFLSWPGSLLRYANMHKDIYTSNIFMTERRSRTVLFWLVEFLHLCFYHSHQFPLVNKPNTCEKSIYKRKKMKLFLLLVHMLALALALISQV